MTSKADLLTQYDEARKALQRIYDIVRAVPPGDWEAAFHALSRVEFICARALGVATDANGGGQDQTAP